MPNVIAFEAKITCPNTSRHNQSFVSVFAFPSQVFTDVNLMYWGTITIHCGACGVETDAEYRGWTMPLLQWVSVAV